MKRAIEQLIKERVPVHPKCQGQGFSKEEQPALVAKRCEKIDPVETNENGQIQVSFTDDACRCLAYVNPSYWWNRGRCPLATHFRPDDKVNTGKKRVGQQKQKKH